MYNYSGKIPNDKQSVAILLFRIGPNLVLLIINKFQNILLFWIDILLTWKQIFLVQIMWISNSIAFFFRYLQFYTR